MLVTEIWRVGVVRAPIEQIAAAGTLDGFTIKWIEADRSLCFLADPFGLWRDGYLYLFAEAYDYRTRRGNIVARKLDADLNVLEHRTVLDEPGTSLIRTSLRPTVRSGCCRKATSQEPCRCTVPLSFHGAGRRAQVQLPLCRYRSLSAVCRRPLVDVLHAACTEGGAHQRPDARHRPAAVWPTGKC